MQPKTQNHVLEKRVVANVLSSTGRRTRLDEKKRGNAYKTEFDVFEAVCFPVLLQSVTIATSRDHDVRTPFDVRLQYRHQLIPGFASLGQQIKAIRVLCSSCCCSFSPSLSFSVHQPRYFGVQCMKIRRTQEPLTACLRFGL